jgi:metal-responsive CopG/Arc/MetJ family transcriptional regulator
MKVEKLTVSVPKDLIDLMDEIARERKVSRSKVVASCLQEFADKRLQEELKAGYIAMAAENLEFARMASELAHEVLPNWE